MRWLLHAFLRRPPAVTEFYQPSFRLLKERRFHIATRMASASTAAVLYATVISTSQITGAVPEDAPDLKHHVKGGKGFRNPWESYREWGVLQISSQMLWYNSQRKTTIEYFAYHRL